MKRMRIAIPSLGQGGIDGKRAGHFGHCDVFTLFDCEDGVITQITTVKNLDHVQGGCMVPVNLLAQHNVDALVVGGIGIRPLMGFQQKGIEVYHEAQQEDIRPVIEDMIAGKIPVIQNEQVCGGGGNGQ